MAKKKVTIVLTTRDENDDSTPYFQITENNMERYELIGLFELAIAHIKQDSFKKTKKIN